METMLLNMNYKGMSSAKSRFFTIFALCAKVGCTRSEILKQVSYISLVSATIALRAKVGCTRS